MTNQEAFIAVLQDDRATSAERRMASIMIGLGGTASQSAQDLALVIDFNSRGRK